MTTNNVTEAAAKHATEQLLSSPGSSGRVYKLLETIFAEIIPLGLTNEWDSDMGVDAASNILNAFADELPHLGSEEIREIAFENNIAIMNINLERYPQAAALINEDDED